METDLVLKVGELKLILSEFPDDMPVVLSKDGEGNYFSPLLAYSDDLRYIEESTSSSGEVISPEDCEADPCDHTSCRYGEGTPVVVLWPAN